MHARNPSPRKPRPWLGFLALVAVPLLVIVDTLVAMSAGWSMASAGAFRLFFHLSIAIAAMVALLCVASARFRAWLGGYAGALVALSASFALSCIVCEIALMQFDPQPGYHLRPANTQYVYEPDAFVMPGVDPDSLAHSTIDARGIRSTQPIDEGEPYRILFVGGSTTECYYIDDDLSWPSLVGQQIADEAGRPSWVGAVGYSEYSTAHHLRFMEESPLLDQVDCVVVLAGSNDMARQLMGFELNAVSGPWWYESHLLRLAKYVWNVRLQQGYFVDRTGEALSVRRRLGREITPKTIDWDQVLADYTARLRAMVETAQRRNVRLVFVTQPVLWDDFLTTFGSKRLWLARVEPMPREWEFLNAPDLRATIERYNDAMLSVGEETGVEVIDAAVELSGREFLFYDDFHLNLAGCREMARVVGQHFARSQNDETETEDSPQP